MNDIRPATLIGCELEPVSHAITRESISRYSRYVFGGRDTRKPNVPQPRSPS